MASTLTQEQTDSIRRKLSEVTLVQDLGAGDHVCSMAAINLALYGKLTDTIPECMSLVIGKWVILVQDKMTPDLRNCPEWRELLPQAAGTGRDPEKEIKRLELLVNWGMGSLVHFFDDEGSVFCTRYNKAEYVREVLEMPHEARGCLDWLRRRADSCPERRRDELNGRLAIFVHSICSVVPCNADNGIWDEHIDPLRLLEAMLAV